MSELPKSPGQRAGGGSRVRVAVIGCGAVAERYHIPILAGHEQVEIAAMVDRDLPRVRKLAAAYGVSQVVSDAAELQRASVDAAVICAPPSLHAPITLALLKQGLHILVEKPIATCLADSQAMVRGAEEAGRVLSVCHFRRLFPSVRVLKAAIAGEILGRPLSFRLASGGSYAWEAATLGNMQKSLAGGGVLMDMGPHFLDILLELFPGAARVLKYEDDASGGVEAHCRAELELAVGEHVVPGTIELSRLRDLGNSLTVQCERGELTFTPSERYSIDVRNDQWQLRDSASGPAIPHVAGLRMSGVPEIDWTATFRAAIDDWLNAVVSGVPSELSGASVLPSMRLIDDCYRMVRPQRSPWELHSLADDDEPSGPRIVRGSENARTVLLTGASGFIGGRVAEILSRRSGYRVRALVHRPSNAARVARLNVELIQGDISDERDVVRMLKNCSAVVHCAIGTETWNPALVRKVTISGTRALLKAATGESVERFVHLSSISVHSDDYRGVIDEKTPVRPNPGELYGISKSAAEKLVRESSLAWTILRPGCVYGPFGKTFVTNPLRALMQGGLILAGSEDAPSNTVYVDHVAEAIVSALEADESACRNVFALADDDGLTWGQFYRFFAGQLGRSYVVEPEDAPTGGSRLSRPGWFSGIGTLARSEELKSLMRKALWTDPVGTLPRVCLDRYPGAKLRLKRALGMQAASVYKRPSITENSGAFRLGPRHAVVCSDFARRVLNWQPSLTREECLNRTWQWLEASCEFAHSAGNSP